MHNRRAFNASPLAVSLARREIVLRSDAFAETGAAAAVTQVLFRFFPVRFFFPSLPAFYPAHPCGTANVSQGLPGTRTVTKWNGRKNEWKTIKEGSREERRRDREMVEEGREEEKEEERGEKRKVDHLAV